MLSAILVLALSPDNVSMSASPTSSYEQTTPKPEIHATYIDPVYKNTPQYRPFFMINDTYPKTHCDLVNFPKKQDLGYFIRRNIPFSKNNNYQLKMCFKINEDGTLQTLLGEMDAFVMDGMGFLPGERVDIKFLGVNPPFSHEISMVPWRLIAGNNEFSIEAELTKCLPTTEYTLSFEGLNVGEVVSVKSIAKDNVEESSFTLPESLSMHYLPGRTNKPGGITTLEITREDGSKASLKLSWGQELSSYVLMGI